MKPITLLQDRKFTSRILNILLRSRGLDYETGYANEEGYWRVTVRSTEPKGKTLIHEMLDIVNNTGGKRIKVANVPSEQRPGMCKLLNKTEIISMLRENFNTVELLDIPTNTRAIFHIGGIK